MRKTTRGLFDKLKHVFWEETTILLASFVIVLSLTLIPWEKCSHIVFHLIAVAAVFTGTKMILPYVKNREIYGAVDSIIEDEGMQRGDVAYRILAAFIRTDAAARVRGLYHEEQGIQVPESELIEINRACFNRHRSVFRRLLAPDERGRGYFALVTEGFEPYLDRYPLFNSSLAVELRRERVSIRILAVDKQQLRREYARNGLRQRIADHLETSRSTGLQLLWVDPNEWERLRAKRSLRAHFALWIDTFCMEYNYGTQNEILIRIVEKSVDAGQRFNDYVATIRDLLHNSEVLSDSTGELEFVRRPGLTESLKSILRA